MDNLLVTVFIIRSQNSSLIYVDEEFLTINSNQNTIGKNSVYFWVQQAKQKWNYIVIRSYAHNHSDDHDKNRKEYIMVMMYVLTIMMMTIRDDNIPVKMIMDKSKYDKDNDCNIR